jgi:SAM-dependent methyltransferase
MNDNFCKPEENSYNFEEHWNNAYLKTPTKSLGWYEENPEQSISLINECNLLENALIFNAGAGSTTLINKLLENGYSNIIVNDIAASALTDLKNDLTIHKNKKVQFIVDDLTNPTELLNLKNIDLWHDRAVLHFFTKESQQNAYFNLIKKAVKSDGFVILAEFNKEGAKKCCGLDVVNYNVEMFQNKLGTDFKLLKSFNYTYTQPSGNKREYVYSLFKRIV